MLLLLVCVNILKLLSLWFSSSPHVMWTAPLYPQHPIMWYTLMILTLLGWVWLSPMTEWCPQHGSWIWNLLSAMLHSRDLYPIMLWCLLGPHLPHHWCCQVTGSDEKSEWDNTFVMRCFFWSIHELLTNGIGIPMFSIIVVGAQGHKKLKMHGPIFENYLFIFITQEV